MFGCIKCKLGENLNGLFSCHGCGENFCLNHIKDHTNEIENRFEEIRNEWNRINDIYQNLKEKSSDLDWKTVYEQKKEINQMKLQINQCEKTLNYSERELDQWMIQLNKFKINESHSFIFKFQQLLASKIFHIYLASILITLSVYYIASLLISNPLLSHLIFTEINGPIQLSDDKCIAEHNGPDFVLGSFRINQTYSEGIHHVELSFELFSSSNTFIGVIQSTRKQSISSSHGWFIGGRQLISHIPGEHRISRILRRVWAFIVSNPLRPYFRRDIESGDIIEITLDCIHRKISLKNQQTNKNYPILIDLKQTPFPWQIIIYFDRQGDRLRLL